MVRKVKAARRKPRGDRSISEDAESSRWAKPDLKSVAAQADHQFERRQLDRARSYPNLSLYDSSLHQNLDESALGFFFSRYVFGYLDKSDTWSVEDGNGCLLASIKALGAAGVTQNGAGPSRSPEAQRRYLDAIQLTNAALQSPLDVKRDSTLLAINILGIFESITGFHRSLSSWQDHIHGAAALLQLRGVEQFDTDTGGRLFMQTCASLVISCTQQRLPIPEHVRKLQVKAEKLIPDPKDRVWRFHMQNLRFADLHAKLLAGNVLRSPDEAEAIIKEALIIEAEIVDLLSNPDADWQYETINANGPAIYAGYYFVFRHYLISLMYTSLFSNRISLHDIIIKAMQACPNPSSLNLSPAEQEHLRHSSEIIHRYQLDIFATVPQHLGISFSQLDFVSPFGASPESKWTPDLLWINFISKDHNPWQSRKKQSPDLPFVRQSGGYLLQWPLWVAGAADVPGGSERRWAIGTLKVIGQSMGVQQAIILANLLEENQGEQLNAHKTSNPPVFARVRKEVFPK